MSKLTTAEHASTRDRQTSGRRRQYRRGHHRQGAGDGYTLLPGAVMTHSTNPSFALSWD
jgi:hypothetical protein